MFYRSYCIRLRIVGCDREVRQATWCIRSVVPSVHSVSSLHSACHQPGNSHPFRSTSCHPDDHGQASEVLRPYRPFGFRWGPHAGHRRSAEGVETTLRSPSSNMASYNRERPQTTEPGAVVCQAQSIWPWTVAWNRGNGNAPAGASYDDDNDVRGMNCIPIILFDPGVILVVTMFWWQVRLYITQRNRDLIISSHCTENSLQTCYVRVVLQP